MLERWTSYDLLVSRPVLRARVQPIRTEEGVDQSVIVKLNGEPVARSNLDASTSLSATLTRPLHRTAPNVIEIEHDYRRIPTARGPEHRIGATGRTSPVDLLVLSGGKLHGDVASIRIGMGEVAPNRRGYNLVALGPEGDLRGRVVFDTLGRPRRERPARRVGARRFPTARSSLGAVKDEASGQLGADAIQALATLGVRRRPPRSLPRVPRLRRCEGRAARVGRRGAGSARRRAPGGGARRPDSDSSSTEFALEPPAAAR